MIWRMMQDIFVYPNGDIGDISGTDYEKANISLANFKYFLLNSERRIYIAILSHFTIGE